MLEAKPNGEAMMYADKDWYSNFCEGYTHVTPKTRPNAHGSTANVGGVYQVDGIDKSLNELSTLLGFIAMIVCRYFKFDDLLREIDEHFDSWHRLAKDGREPTER